MAIRNRHFFVAIVDDDAGVRRAIQNLLSSDGFRTRGFSSAEQFLRSRDGRRAGCLILDVQLPRMSGPALQQDLHAQGSSIPVILVTAAGVDRAWRRRQRGRTRALSVLGKPFDPERLLQLVRSVFEAWRSP